MLRNGIYNVSGQTIRGAAALLTIPFLVHFLGIREYGVWSLAYAVLALLLIGEAGLSVAATVFLSRDLVEQVLDEASGTLTFVLASGTLVSLIMGLALWLCGPMLARSLTAFSIPDRTEVGRALSIAGLAVAAFIFQRVLIGIEQAFDRYGTINALDVLQSLLANVGLIVVAWGGGKSVELMKWQVFVWVCLLFAHCCFVLRLLRGRRLGLRWNGMKAKRMLRFAVAAWTSMFGSAVFSQCDRLVVGGILGAPVLGIYSAITNITSKINSFSGMAVQPLVPSLSRAVGRTAPVEDRVRAAAHLNALIAVEAALVLCLLADRVMSIMVPGANTPQNVLGLQIATLVYAIYSINAPGYFILFSVGQEWKNALVTLSSAVLSLGLIFVGARFLGLVGALAGNAGYFGTLFMVGLAIRKIGVALRRYASWVAFPLLSLMAAFVVGLALQGYFGWRVAFVFMQAGLLVVWFFREQNGLARLRVAWGRVAQGE